MSINNDIKTRTTSNILNNCAIHVCTVVNDDLKKHTKCDA